MASKKEKAAVASVFGAAEASAPAPKRAKDAGKAQVAMGAEFESYVALILVEKALDGVKKQLDRQFKDEEAFDHFSKSLALGQPSSFEGVGGRASAQFQFKKRSQGFSPATAQELDRLGIAYDRIEKVPERFTINPRVFEDQDLLCKLAVAIKDMNVGYDIIQKQAPVHACQFTDETLSQIAGLKDREQREELLRAVSTVAVAQARIDGADAKGGAVGAALEILQEHGLLSLDEVNS